MANEEPDETGFTIVDKRGGEAEERPAATAEPEPPVGLPPVDFPSFLISLGTSALYHLGLVPDPTTGEPGAKNIEMARHTIDTIVLLEQKTQGNLSDDEVALFQNLLTELRMRFVEATTP
jgi:hypothetical protein